MFLQGPIVIVAEKSVEGLIQAFSGAGAYPVVEAPWAKAPAAIDSINPSAVVITDADGASPKFVNALMQSLSKSVPYLPAIMRVRDEATPPLPGVLPIGAEAPIGQMIARLSSAIRLRSLHATVIGRAQTLKDERNIIADLPEGDPLDDATVLVVGRGPAYPALTTAVGERVGVMGALSLDGAAGCLSAREIDGLVIGDGLPARSLEAFFHVLADDARFRDLPVAALGHGIEPENLGNFIRAPEPALLVERMLPLIRARALEGQLKRLLASIEHKGMLDARTGLLFADAFGRDLDRAIGDAAERGVSLSVARFSFEDEMDRRANLDAARLISRLVRNIDFACRQDDGSIVAVFTQTDLKAAHVVARRLASVLKHTLLRANDGRSTTGPSVTLATLKGADTAHSLIARVTSRPVAAA
jgi:GGDEF domain-containing protein